ncbi:MAG: hypothetical protein J5641_01640 [Bacteroidales bacterium]|nr:hypothetical protein [Bacteroidales bacterium]
MKKEYMKPTQRVVELRHWPMLLAGSNEVNNLDSDYLDYVGSDEGYDEGAR